MSLMGQTNPLADPPKVADKSAVRKFVTDLAEVAETIKDARSDLKEAINSNDDIIAIDEKIKLLREERKEVILASATIQGYANVLGDATEDKRQLISDAKQDGVPRGEIDLAIKALKKDLDMTVSTEIYANIADLIE